MIEQRRKALVALVVHPHITHYFQTDATTVIPDSRIWEISKNPVPLQDDAFPYFYRYLFGADGYHGILADYGKQEWQVNVIDENHFKSTFESLVEQYEYFDFQFSGNVDAGYVRTLMQQGKGVVGWAPPILGNKQFQTVMLANYPDTATFIPRQIHLSALGHVKMIGVRLLENHFPSPYLIAKPFYSSRSKMPDGSDYRVLHISCWQEYSRELLEHPNWFDGVNGITISEFVLTDDPYTGNRNGVVHKINLPAGFDAECISEWPYLCDKFAGIVEPELARHSVQSFGNVLKGYEWLYGSLSEYKSHLQQILNVLLPIPCLVSVDLMLRPSGQIAFFEINKLAGTFGNTSGGEQCPLQRYMSLALPDLMNRKNRLNRLDAYMNRLKEIVPLLSSFKPLPYAT